MRPRFFVFGDQAQQQAFLERAGQTQIADLRILGLPVPIDAAVALLQPVGVVGQIQMNQMVAALLQVQPFGQRIRANQNKIVFHRTPLGGSCAGLLAVMAGDG